MADVRLRIVLNSLEVFVAAAFCSYGTGGGKKSASLTLHCDMAGALPHGAKKCRPLLEGGTDAAG
jgi:hypothetical protein